MKDMFTDLQFFAQMMGNIYPVATFCIIFAICLGGGLLYLDIFHGRSATDRKKGRW